MWNFLGELWGKGPSRQIKTSSVDARGNGYHTATEILPYQALCDILLGASSQTMAKYAYSPL